MAEERGETWTKANLETKFKDTYASKEFVEGQIVGYVPQVKKTYGLFESLFAMINEENVAIGESTCAARFGENAVPRSCPTCEGPLFDVAAVSLIALERCDTARCAVKMMGDLAVEHGYYGAGTEEGDRGEALTVADSQDLWMMHLSPDDTGKSAVWVAQRVPDNHVTAAANAFVIRGVDPKSDDFMYSDNLWKVAERAGVAKYTKRANGLLDFAVTYGPDEFAEGMMKKPEYSTDRIWRVFSLLAPSRKFKRSHNFWGDEFPFSVEVEKKVSVQDMMKLNRDYYEGSELDLTKGFAAGPFGSPIRFDPGFGYPGQTAGDNNENGLTQWDRMYGAFPRAIGIMRTSWHFVAQLRPKLPRAVAGVMWFSQYHPASGAYAPLYSSSSTTPKMYQRGSLYEYSEDSSFWKFCTVGNYAQLAWKYIYPDVFSKQQEVEDKFVASVATSDAAATALMKEGKRSEAVEVMTNFSHAAAGTIFTEWHSLLHGLFAKYHDGYIAITSSDVFDASEFFYPRWWLVLTDFFTNVIKDHDWKLPSGLETLDNVFGEKKDSVLKALGMAEGGGSSQIERSSKQVGGGLGVGIVTIIAAVFGAVGFMIGRKQQSHAGYLSVPDV